MANTAVFSTSSTLPFVAERFRMYCIVLVFPCGCPIKYLTSLFRNRTRFACVQKAINRSFLPLSRTNGLSLRRGKSWPIVAKRRFYISRGICIKLSIVSVWRDSENDSLFVMYLDHYCPELCCNSTSLSSLNIPLTPSGYCGEYVVGE